MHLVLQRMLRKLVLVRARVRVPEWDVPVQPTELAVHGVPHDNLVHCFQSTPNFRRKIEQVLPRCLEEQQTTYAATEAGVWQWAADVMAAYHAFIMEVLLSQVCSWMCCSVLPCAPLCPFGLVSLFSEWLTGAQKTTDTQWHMIGFGDMAHVGHGGLQPAGHGSGSGSGGHWARGPRASCFFQVPPVAGIRLCGPLHRLDASVLGDETQPGDL